MTPQEILEIEKNIVYTLKNIYDPEIPVNIYDLGLIYEVDVTPGSSDGPEGEQVVAHIRMTLTAPNCPMADMLLQQVHDDVLKVEKVEKVEVTLTFDPPWDRSMISEEALLEMGMM